MTSVGFLLIKNFLDELQLSDLERIIKEFHQSWLTHHADLYKKGAVNSAYLTGGDFLSSDNRLSLLKFVSSTKVVSEAKRALENDDIRFLNTQLFFNPFNNSQKNYWHRDIQYTGIPEDEQRRIIEEKPPEVIHLRLALADENGLEFIPGSNKRWDSAEEYETRFQLNNKKCQEDLSTGQTVPLKRGDLLVFDANMIHRGLYGKDRLAFDILFCRPLPHIVKFIDEKVLPKKDELQSMECPEVFSRISILK